MGSSAIPSEGEDFLEPPLYKPRWELVFSTHSRLDLERLGPRTKGLEQIL